MKKILCAVLALALVFGLAACGGKEEEPTMPAFSEEALTVAQEYVKAAMEDYEIPDKSLDFKDARVMLTDDLAKDLAGEVEITKWDVSEYDAVVVVYLGEKVEEPEVEETTKKSKKAAAETTAAEEGATEAQPQEDWKPVVFLLGGEDKEVGYYRAFTDSTAVDAEQMAQNLAEGLPVDEVEGAAGGADSDAVTDAKKALAQAQLDTENYLTENAEKLGDFPATIAAKIEANPDYVYSLEYFTDNLAENDYVKGFYAGHLRNEYRAEYRLAQLTAENPKDEDLIEEDYLLFDDKYTMLKAVNDINATIANLEATAADQLVEYKAALETAKAKEDYFFDETYTRAALANESANTYDNCLRQLALYQSSLEALEQVMASSDEKEREYLAERAALVDANLAEYTNMYKTYVQCLVNLSNFEATNAEALAAYDAEVAAVKEAVGDGYLDSVEYMKVQLKYEEMLTSHAGFKNAIPLAKADLDAMKAEQDEALLKLETEEQARLDSIIIIQEETAFFEYAVNAVATVSEYEAAKGQWGSVHPDYAAYQNQHLDYYTPSYSSGSSYSGGSSSSSKGNKYDPDDELYSSHDYNNDGYINDQEFQDALGDYMDELMYGY